MAFSRTDAVDTARMILNDHAMRERARLNRIAWALNPRARYRGITAPRSERDLLDYVDPPAVILPTNAPPSMRNLARKSRTNYLPRVLNEFVQALKVDGYKSEGGTDNAAPWKYAWQANRLDGRQGGIHRDALAYGISFATVLPGTDPMTGAPAPVVRGCSPRKMTALYEDAVDDDWPMMALRHDDPLLRLYDEEQVYFVGQETHGGMTELTYIDAQAHGMNVCPVIRFRDEMLLDESDQMGIIEPLLAIQSRLDETVFGMLVAQFFAAFKQRVVLGWVPKDEEEQLRASSSNLWTFKDGPDQVKIDEFSETDLTRYIQSKESAVTDLATISQVPPQTLGNGSVSNLSAEALASMEAGKNRRADTFATSIGESWEQTLRLAASIIGDEESANDVSAQVRWAEKEARSFAQMVDGLGKMVQMLGVPARATWSMIPGVSDTDVDAWEQMASEGDALGALNRLLAEQAAAGKPPTGQEITEMVTQTQADQPPVTD